MYKCPPYGPVWAIVAPGGNRCSIHRRASSRLSGRAIKVSNITTEWRDGHNTPRTATAASDGRHADRFRRAAIDREISDTKYPPVRQKNGTTGIMCRVKTVYPLPRTA